MGLNKITFMHVSYFESKERLGNTCVLRHGVHHLHSVQPSTTCSQTFVSLSEVTIEVRLQTLHTIMSECESLYSNKISFS